MMTTTTRTRTRTRTTTIIRTTTTTTTIITTPKSAIRDFYSLLTAPRTVSNTYVPVARAQSCANHVQHIELQPRATRRVPHGTKGQLDHKVSHSLIRILLAETSNRWRYHFAVDITGIQTTMEDTDGGLHPAVDGQSLDDDDEMMIMITGMSGQGKVGHSWSRRLTTRQLRRWSTWGPC